MDAHGNSLHQELEQASGEKLAQLTSLVPPEARAFR
jgi:hypothetical protein